MDERVEALRYWAESAPVWQATLDRGEPNRTILLYPVMLALCGDVRGLEVLEPVPTDDSLRAHPDFEDWFRVPQFWVMRWEKSE